MRKMKFSWLILSALIICILFTSCSQSTSLRLLSGETFTPSASDKSFHTCRKVNTLPYSADACRSRRSNALHSDIHGYTCRKDCTYAYTWQAAALRSSFPDYGTICSAADIPLKTVSCACRDRHEFQTALCLI